MPSSNDRLVTAKDISKHNTIDDLWMVIDGVVYNLTDFAPSHPGGPAVLAHHAGRDGTAAYSEVHAPSLITSTLPKTSIIGILDKSSPLPQDWTTPETSTEEQPASAPFTMTNKETPATTNGSNPQTPSPISSKPPLAALINLHDFALAAETSLTRKAWAFASSAATDCLTHERNSSTYSGITLRPRVLRNVSSPDLSTTILGRRIASPFFCAPTSMGRIYHPQGERELGRGCRSMGIPQVVSTSCSYPFAEVMDAVEEDRQIDKTTRGAEASVPVFFQLYVDKDRARSEALLRSVVARGASGIFLTVDAPVIGKREADERVSVDQSLRMPMTGAKPTTDNKGGGLGRLMGSFIDSTLTWDAVSWIRGVVGPKVPIAIKGIQTAADAVKAMEVGADAIYISNHGGRSLDTAPAGVVVLLELHRCCPEVFDKMEVFVDGGIRRGTDIFKALCLGAKAVGLGRPFLYGLNYGKEGIEKVVSILNDELQTTMQMCGITSLDQCHPGLLHTGAIDHLVPQGEEHPYAKWRPKAKL